MHVVGVPVQIGNGAIILPRVEHDQVEQTANAEAAPDAKVVVHFDLPDRHPLKVSTDGIHLALIS